MYFVSLSKNNNILASLIPLLHCLTYNNSLSNINIIFASLIVLAFLLTFFLSVPHLILKNTTFLRVPL